MPTPLSPVLVDAVQRTFEQLAFSGLQFIKQSDQKASESFRTELVEFLIAEFCRTQELDLDVPSDAAVSALQAEVDALKARIAEEQKTVDTIVKKKK